MGAFFASSHCLVRLILRHWDALLLSIFLCALTGMTGYLLWPQPQTVLNLRPAASSMEVVAPAVLDSEAEPLQAQTPVSEKHSKSRRHKPAKPKAPPVLNINTASLQQLQLLPGIGPKMAERVLQYRKEHGVFRSPEEIMEVKGIGPKKFEKLRPYLRV
ncbi:MAG TPA: helix-hairpin-helix domain-containing protein [Oculatellaceae cyanobacterium]|jgi:competence protein ComEA